MSKKLFENFHDKLLKGELPLRAEVTSKDEQEVTMTIGKASLIKDGVESVILDDEITLSTNSVDGDKTNEAAAIVSIPPTDDAKPRIDIRGNASVTNDSRPYTIGLEDNVKKMKCKSSGGLFSVIKIGDQRDENFQYFEVIFGEEGEAEEVDSDGRKKRPHISFFPSGTGKYIRLAGYDCELKGTLGYDVENKNIFPNRIEIYLQKYSESLILNFQFKPIEKIVTLISSQFK